MEIVEGGDYFFQWRIARIKMVKTKQQMAKLSNQLAKNHKRYVIQYLAKEKHQDCPAVANY